MDVFQIRDLSFSYPEQNEKALDGLRFSIPQGQFLTICGPSGGGKSTFLRQLKTTMAPHGLRTGEILFQGKPLEEAGQREQAQRIGFVQQSPENQIVTDKVWHELAFGLESLGYDTPAIRGRVAEMASFFGIEGWFYKNVSELSGGQKQLLNLASVMALGPSVLILDEPTSQLDPIAASDFLTTVGRINRELGTTVIMTEHRLEDVFPLSQRVLVMDKGRIIADGTPQQVGESLKNEGHSMFAAMPAAMRIWAAVENGAPCPVTVRDGRRWISDFAQCHELCPVEKKRPEISGDTVIDLDGLWFRYEKELPDVVKGLTLQVRRGELFAILGGNGAGKTTTLSLIGGLQGPQRGSVRVCGSIGILPQNPQTLFVKKTVREDLFEMLRDRGLEKPEQDARVARAAGLCRLHGLMDRHPYDLSGGEQQRAALAKVLLLEPEVLLMDEPTKGLDAEFKQSFAGILHALQRRGVTIVMVSHDVEFCAEFADSCALFFDGSIVTRGAPGQFFSGNSFYTTSANRMARHLLPEAVTARDVILACGGSAQEPENEEEIRPVPASELEKPEKAKKLPLWRRLLAAASGLGAAILFIITLRAFDLSELVTANGVSGQGKGSAWVYIALVALLIICSLAVGQKSKRPELPARQKRKLSKRTIAAAVTAVLLIPATLLLGVRLLGGRKYYFISLLVLIEAMLPFALVFEGRRPKARELVVIAVLCAMGVAGRAVFFMLPSFKPVMALVIISAVAFGGETGFLVGAMTMLCSNIMFGQGPWTPWQMFAMGIIGFIAGVLFRKGLLGRSRMSLCIFGAIAAVVVYGGIMNPASALMWAHTLNWQTLLSYYITGFPVDLVHAAATVVFLWFGAEPMLEKLDRIKVKYGLVE